MTMYRSRLSSVALVLAGLLAVLGLLPASASAASAPYTDPNAIGYLGFCNAADQQITSGSIMTQPFVVKAVSSIPPPAHYSPPQGRAVLYVFQPIQYVDPSDWSGKQLTAATAYTNAQVPMTVGTKLDPSMFNFSSVFPLHVNGFAQVRMYYTAQGQTEYAFKYPAANVQITGNTWKQVGGGTVNCKAGQAYSNEFVIPGRIPSGTPLGKQPTKASLPPGVGTSSTPGTGGTGTASVSASAAANAKKSSSSSSGALWGVLAVVILLLAGGGGYLAMKRRHAGVTPTSAE